MKTLIISDTHNKHKTIKNIDTDTELIIHCGDATNHYSPYRNVYEWNSFYSWFVNLPIKYKIYVPGNHDSYLYHNISYVKSMLPENFYILDRKFVTINDITFYGDPYTPNFGSWYFMDDEIGLKRTYEMLLDVDIDVVITHGPPFGIRDLAPPKRHCGSTSLMEFIANTQPKYHLFGHIHDENVIINNNGISVINNTKYINASYVNNEYQPNNKELIYINF